MQHVVTSGREASRGRATKSTEHIYPYLQKKALQNYPTFGWEATRNFQQFWQEIGIHAQFKQKMKLNLLNRYIFEGWSYESHIFARKLCIFCLDFQNTFFDPLVIAKNKVFKNRVIYLMVIHDPGYFFNLYPFFWSSTIEPRISWVQLKLNLRNTQNQR